jgi:hypothetical protein
MRSAWLLLLALPLAPAAAQVGRTTTTATDAAAGASDLDALERRLYDASRRAPRDPAARAALGEWLAARGQLRSGAVLLEEARLFGGDGRTIAARLAHIYTWLHDWSSLAALPDSPLSVGEKARARALTDRSTSVAGPDSVIVPFAPLELGALGRVPLVLGADTVWAEVDPQEEGIVLSGLARGAGLVELHGEVQRNPIGVLQECSLGELTLRDVPVRVDASLGAGRARLGFDVFAWLAPTVDGRAGTVTLRRAGRISEQPTTAAVPMVLGFPGVRIVARTGESLVPLASPAGRAALRGHRWTVDLRRGVIWLGDTR